MDYKDDLERIVFLMAYKSENSHKILRSAPNGTLEILNDGKYIRLMRFMRENGKPVRRGIKKQPGMVKRLAQKAYYEEYVKRLDQNIKLLKGTLKKFQSLEYEDILNALPANYNLLPDEYVPKWKASKMHPVYDDSVRIRDFERYVPEDERGGWGEMPYRANDYQVEHIKQKTVDGFYMRSKSEVALLEIYARHEIPVHYDEKMRFDGVVKSPDMVAMRYDGKLVIHEHCGLVNNPEYMWAHREKMALYEACGIVPWDNLIVTYESPEGGIDLALAEAEICAKLKR